MNSKKFDRPIFSSLTDRKISSPRSGVLSQKLFLSVCALTLALFFVGDLCCKAAISNNIPNESLKTLPMAPEKSVSTYVPSKAAPNGGLAVTISYPTMARYKDEGCPVVVVVPGYGKASGLRFTMHAPQSGFIEVKFAFPGGGLKKFHSGGSWDGRGPSCQLALRDVLVFAHGLSRDYKGRTIHEVIPQKAVTNNIGVVGWHDGFNLVLITLAKYHEHLGFVKWITSYESPIGSFLYPSNLGTTKELNLNSHYRQGSAATGKCNVDFDQLTWDGKSFRHRTRRSKKKLHTPKGVLFFDDNKNGKFDELTEFPLNYAIEPGVNKQFYCPEITHAITEKKLFVSNLNMDDLNEDSFEKLVRDYPHVVDILGSNKKPAADPEGGNRIKLEMWPKTIATLAQSERYFKERNGALYINKIGKLFPDLLVTIFGSRIDHNEQQTDHPHIVLSYNRFLDSKIKWVRLNPARVYVGFTADMNPANFVNNKIKAPIDASKIENYLEPEGLIADTMYMRAAISELADRVQNKDLSCPLEGVLENYLNEALIKRQMELESKSSSTEEDSGP